MRDKYGIEIKLDTWIAFVHEGEIYKGWIDRMSGFKDQAIVKWEFGIVENPSEEWIDVNKLIAI